MRAAFRAKLTSDLIATVGGLVTTVEGGDLKPGTGANLKLVWDVRQYKLEINNEVIWDINFETGKRVVGGIDQLAPYLRSWVRRKRWPRRTTASAKYQVGVGVRAMVDPCIAPPSQ